MTSSPNDLRTLRRAPTSSPPSASGAITAVPRPRARWATRMLIPLAVLLATAGVLAYAARDAFRPRLSVYVAAAIPKAGVAVGLSDEEPGANADPEVDTDSMIGPVIVQAPGWIEPAPFAVSVPALAEGVVKEILVLEGERVEAGQVVARFIDDDAKLGLRVADATVSERASDVERAKASLATAESRVIVERIAADELRDEVMRKRGLVDAGGVAAGDFRRMEIRLGGLEAKVVTAEKEASEARAAAAQTEAAKNAALVAREEAALRLSRMEVRSGVAGVVLARLVEPGSRISMSGKSGESDPGGSMTGAVLRVYDPAKLQVRVDVPLAEAAKVGLGTRATVSTEALADQTFGGVVSRVVHEANIQRNTVQFKVALDAPSPVLKPEMLTRVKLHAPAADSQRRSNGGVGGTAGADSVGELTLLVPTAAVASVGGNKGRVWVVDTSGGSPVSRLRDVTTVPSADEGFTAVTSGLRLTDRIILDPPAPPAIREGMRLKVLGERSAASAELPSFAP